MEQSNEERGTIWKKAKKMKRFEGLTGKEKRALITGYVKNKRYAEIQEKEKEANRRRALIRAKI